MKFTPSQRWLSVAKAAMKETRWRVWVRKTSDFDGAIAGFSGWREISHHINLADLQSSKTQIEYATNQFSADSMTFTGMGIKFFKERIFNVTGDERVELKLQLEIGYWGNFATDECYTFAGWVDTRPEAIRYDDTTDTLQFTALTQQDLGLEIPAERIVVQYFKPGDPAVAGMLRLQNITLGVGDNKHFYIANANLFSKLTNGGLDQYTGGTVNDPTTNATFTGWTSVLGSTSTSGLLVTGRDYKIVTYVAGDDFTNVGASSNATGVTFTATGTTPTNWTNGSTLLQIGGTISAVNRSASYNIIGSAAYIKKLASSTMYLHQDIIVTPGDEYLLYAFCIAYDANASYQVRDLTHSTDIIAATTVTQNGIGGKQVTASFTVPAACFSIRLFLYGATGVASGSVYWDQVSLIIPDNAGTSVNALQLGEHVLQARYNEQTGRNVVKLDGGIEYEIQTGATILSDSPDGIQRSDTQLVQFFTPLLNPQFAPMSSDVMEDYLVVTTPGDLIPYQWPWTENVDTVLDRFNDVLGIGDRVYGELNFGPPGSNPMKITNARYPGKSVTEAINDILRSWFLIGTVTPLKQAFVYARCDDDGETQSSGNTLALTENEISAIGKLDGRHRSIYVIIDNGSSRRTWDGTNWDETQPEGSHPIELKVDRNIVADQYLQPIARRIYKWFNVARVRIPVQAEMLPRAEFDLIDLCSINVSTPKTTINADGPIYSFEIMPDGTLLIEAMIAGEEEVGGVPEGALLTESGDIITTESGETLVEE